MIIKNSQCQSHVRFEKWKLDWEQKANFVLWIIHKNIYIVFARNNHCRLLLVCCFLLTHSSPVRVCKYFLTYSDIYIYHNYYLYLCIWYLFITFFVQLWNVWIWTLCTFFSDAQQQPCVNDEISSITSVEQKLVR